MILESMNFPAPVIYGGHRAEVQGRPGEARHRDPAARRGGPDLPGPHRRGDRPDDHRRHGRAAPRGAGRPDEARVPRRGQHRQAAGRLPRDHPQEGRAGTTTPTRSRPVGPASTPRSRSTIEPTGRRRRRLRVREQGHRRSHPAGVHPVGRRRRPGGHGVRRPGRLPAGRHQGDAARRRLPRGRLVRAGLQDRRLDGVQGGGPQGGPGAPRADDVRRGDHARGLHG